MYITTNLYIARLQIGTDKPRLISAKHKHVLINAILYECRHLMTAESRGIIKDELSLDAELVEVKCIPYLQLEVHAVEMEFDLITEFEVDTATIS